MQSKVDEKEYNIWNNEHEEKCSINYFSTAPNMECTGALRMFERSLSTRGAVYANYYGDGDSKSFQTVRHVFKTVEVKKIECIGHYQNRVGNRLRKLKNNNKGLGGRNKSKIPVNKDNGMGKAKSRLTDSIIDKLQNYFGITLRSNTGNLKEMKESILASLFHISSSADKECHDYCPKSTDSWCQYQRDQVNKTNLSGPGLSRDIIETIKPIYHDLTKDTVLSRCLHGVTQNANESFNSTIWERVPKLNFCGMEKLMLAVYDAIAVYNYGRKATLDIFKNLNIIPGFYTNQMCQNMNIKRKYSAGYKNMDSHNKEAQKNYS